MSSRCACRAWTVIDQLALIIRSHLLAVTQRNDFTDNDFTLAKHVCQIFGNGGQFLISHHKQLEVPAATWTQYLTAMHVIFSHKNQIYNSISSSFWKEFLRQPNLSKPYVDDACVERLMSAIPAKLSKQDASEISTAFEFDAKEEYDAFYYKFRADALDLLRALTAFDERTGYACYSRVTAYLHSALATNASAANWEIISVLMDAVCNKLKMKHEVCNTSSSLQRYVS